jgi:hypothetical protein
MIKITGESEGLTDLIRMLTRLQVRNNCGDVRGNQSDTNVFTRIFEFIAVTGKLCGDVCFRFTRGKLIANHADEVETFKVTDTIIGIRRIRDWFEFLKTGPENDE